MVSPYLEICAEFFCRKDTRGNVVELLDSAGAGVVKYKYDAWVKCQTTVDGIGKEHLLSLVIQLQPLDNKLVVIS